MRRMITGKLIEWIKSLKEKVVQNGNTTEVGGDLEVDGNVKVNTDKGMNVNDEIIFGVAYIPESLTEDTGGERRQATQEEIEWIKSHLNYSHFKYADILYNNSSFYTIDNYYEIVCSNFVIESASSFGTASQLQITLENNQVVIKFFEV